jgi:hypothetical protein
MGVLLPMAVPTATLIRLLLSVAVLTDLAIVVLAPGMYVEKALNILAVVFMVAGITTLVLVRRRR